MRYRKNGKDKMYLGQVVDCTSGQVVDNPREMGYEDGYGRFGEDGDTCLKVRLFMLLLSLFSAYHCWR